MKKAWLLLLVLGVSNSFAALSLQRTRYDKASPKLLQSYAEQGKAEAQYELAQRYYVGRNAPKDAIKAFHWMNRAAELKHPAAMQQVSIMHAEGIGTAIDAQKAESCLIAVLTVAPHSRGVRTLYETHLKKLADDPTAKDRFLTRSIEAGYDPAYITRYSPKAAALCLNGKFTEAVPMLRKLTEMGDVISTCYLAQGYQNGLGGLRKDPVEAFELYQHAAEKGQDLAQYELGMMCENGIGTAVDAKQAKQWFEKSAERGNADAQFRFAELEFETAQSAKDREQIQNQRGKLSHQKTTQSALKWYRAAAEQGHAKAQYTLGRLRASGEGARKDNLKALNWYRKAAAQNHPEALFHLGLMHQAGLGTPRDSTKAMQLYRQAADLGSTGAFYYLANGLRFGQGASKNPDKGERIYYWNILKGISMDAQTSLNEWALDAAREYGIILWQKATTPEELNQATEWIAISALDGNELSENILTTMLAHENSRKSKKEKAQIAENKANPADDASRPLRSPALFPYIQQPLDDLFPRSKAKQEILSVQKPKNGFQTVAGNETDGLVIRYSRPRLVDATGFAATFLIGIELTDRQTGDHYWSLTEHRDQDPLFKEISTATASIFVDLSDHPKAKITDWAVIYGHLLPSGRILAVLDHEESSERTLQELHALNRHATLIPSSSLSIVDTWTGLGVTLEDIDQQTTEDIKGDINDLKGSLFN